MKFFKGNENNRIQQKTVFQWALSYLPVLLIPLILGGLLYAYSMNAVQEKAETIQNIMMEDRSDTLEDMFEKVGSLTVRIQGNEAINELASTRNWGGEQRYMLIEVQSMLSELLINNEELQEIILYFPDKGQILSTSAAYNVEWDEEFRARMGMDQDTFFKMLSGNLYGTYHIQEKDQLYYTSVYKKNDHFLKQKMIVIVKISNAYMDYLLHTEEVDFFLADEAGRHYVAQDTIGKGEVGVEESMALSFADGPMQWIDTTCIFRDDLENYGLSLYSIQQDVGYVSALWNMRLLLVGYLLVCLVVGGLLVWYQTRRNYRPVDEMLTVIRRHGYLESKSLAEAGKSLQHLIDEYEDRKDESNVRDQIILEHGMHQLFHPETDKMSRGDEQTYGLFCSRLGSGVRQVVRFRIAAAEETGLDRELLTFMLQNILGELLEAKVPFILSPLGESFYLLSGERMDGGLSLQKEEMETVSNFFLEQCGIDVDIEMSSLQEGWAGIQRGYDEVRALAEYRAVLTGYPRVICYEELQQEPLLLDFYRLFSLERKMGAALMEHRLEVIEGELDTYKKYLETEVMLNWRGLSSESVEQEEVTRQVTDQVKEYIDANYTDKQLTVGALAERFEVSTPWLSRNYKKEKGCGVLEYIGQLRMEKAKELLLSGLTVAETSEQVGYYSSRPLIRLFTENVGMTPMKYVKSQKQEADEREAGEALE